MNAVRRIFSHLFPTPRRPITWKTAIPLVAFLLVFFVLCVYLEAAGKMLFANRWGFLLMIAAPWIWWMHAAGHSGLPKIRGTLSLLVRLALVGLFAMLMAEPRAVRTSDTLSVMYALDISDSIGEGSTDGALEFVSATVTGKPEKDEAGLVVFGRNASVELPPRINFLLKPSIHGSIETPRIWLNRCLLLPRCCRMKTAAELCSLATAFKRKAPLGLSWMN